MSEKFSKKEFIDGIKSIASSVYDFHARWNLLESSSSPYKLLSEREPLLQEEIKELIAEYNKDDQNRSVTLLSREAADVLYISVGSMLALGKNGIEAMNQVSEKNNNKTSKTHYFNKSEKKVKKLDI